MTGWPVRSLCQIPAVSPRALQDADHDTAGSAALVAFEVELGFEDLVDRLDGLPQRPE
jgi:hypothetical protein